MILLKRIKKHYGRWLQERLLKEFCLSQSPRPRGARAFHYFLIFCGVGIAVLLTAPDFRSAFFRIGAALLAMVCIAVLRNRWEFARALQECRKKVGRAEYNRRLEHCSHHDVLKMLMKKIQTDYPQCSLRLTDSGILEGEHDGKKVAVCYLYPDESGIIEAREVIGILRECRLNSVDIVRIFANGRYSGKVFALAERYEIDVRLYNCEKLYTFFKDSALVPSDEEVAALIKLAIQKRKRAAGIIRKEMLQRKKTVNYLLYSAVLFVLAWLEIGPVWWNIGFAVILLVLGASSFLQKRIDTAEEGVF